VTGLVEQRWGTLGGEGVGGGQDLFSIEFLPPKLKERGGGMNSALPSWTAEKTNLSLKEDRNAFGCALESLRLS